jgi:hypothetical protein
MDVSECCDVMRHRSTRASKALIPSPPSILLVNFCLHPRDLFMALTRIAQFFQVIPGSCELHVLNLRLAHTVTIFPALPSFMSQGYMRFSSAAIISGSYDCQIFDSTRAAHLL